MKALRTTQLGSLSRKNWSLNIYVPQQHITPRAFDLLGCMHPTTMGREQAHSSSLPTVHQISPLFCAQICLHTVDICTNVHVLPTSRTVPSEYPRKTRTASTSVLCLHCTQRWKNQKEQKKNALQSLELEQCWNTGYLAIMAFSQCISADLEENELC